MFNEKMFYRNKGSTLAFTMIIIMVLAIFTSALVTMLRQETKWELKHRRSSTAFHLAEAAVDRGYWKLTESKDVWDSVADGTFGDDGHNPEYVGGEFTDIEGGTYKITITTTSDEYERKIIGIGRDSSTDEMRMIEVIVKHVAVEAAMSAPALDVMGKVVVHWAPVKSISGQGLTLQGAAEHRYYPRKYSVGKIDPRDTDPDKSIPDTGYGNSDNVEYWAYASVEAPSGIDDAYYIAKATATGTYWDGAHDFDDQTDNRDDTSKVYYVNGDCELKNSYLKGDLIVRGNLSLSGNGKGEYDAEIPENAQDEYQSTYDDTIPKSAAQYWIDEFDGKTVYGLTKVIVEGFVYVEGDLKGNGGGTFNGCIQVDGSTADLQGNVDIYYNQDIAQQVETTELNVSRVSWKEIKPSW